MNAMTIDSLVDILVGFVIGAGIGGIIFLLVAI